MASVQISSKFTVYVYSVLRVKSCHVVDPGSLKASLYWLENQVFQGAERVADPCPVTYMPKHVDYTRVLKPIVIGNGLPQIMPAHSQALGR